MEMIAHVAVHGIWFDTNKSEVNSESGMMPIRPARIAGRSPIEHPSVIPDSG